MRHACLAAVLATATLWCTSFVGRRQDSAPSVCVTHSSSSRAPSSTIYSACTPFIFVLKFNVNIVQHKARGTTRFTELCCVVVQRPGCGASRRLAAPCISAHKGTTTTAVTYFVYSGVPLGIIFVTNYCTWRPSSSVNKRFQGVVPGSINTVCLQQLSKLLPFQRRRPRGANAWVFHPTFRPRGGGVGSPPGGADRSSPRSLVCPRHISRGGVLR